MKTDRITILVVDDNPVDRKLVKSYVSGFRHVQCTMHECATVDDAFKQLKENTYDVCLVDQFLHGREGSELISQANMFGLKVPIVIMTGYPAYDLDETIMLSGAEDFIAKDEMKPDLLERTLLHAIIRSRTRSKLVEDRRLDVVTSALTRREFLIQARFELLRCQRFKRSAGVLLIDIDQFSLLNARYGHDAGDRAITDLADRCRNIVRSLDAIGRYGGDELAILLPETPVTGVEVVVEKLFGAYKDRPLEVHSRQLPIALSIGATLMSPNHTSMESVMHVVENAVERAKETSGNSYEFVSPPVLGNRDDAESEN